MSITAALAVLQTYDPVHLALSGLALAFVVACIYYRDHAVGTHRRPDLYSPPGHPIIGNLIQVVKNSGRQFEWFTQLRQELNAKGDFRRISISLPGLRMIDCTDPSFIEHIQKGNSANYVKGPLFKGNMSDILGAGIFVVDGDAWRVARKATSKVFTGTLFRTVIKSSIETDLSRLEKVLDHHVATGEPVDLCALFFAFTLNSFGRMAFSVDIGALTETAVKPVPFAVAFDYAQERMAKRFNNPLWPVTENAFTSTGRKMAACSKVLDDFAYGIIDEREREGLGTFTGDQKAEAGKTDLLSLYMAIRDENGVPMSRSALRDSVLNLIIAGRDTTAQALAWTTYHLLRSNNPSLIANIRKEVDEVEGGVVDYDSYKTLTHSLATFHEGLRLHPSVPKNGHQAVADDQIPNGPFIHAGEIAIWSDWRMGRSESIWGADAGTFRPSRWIDPSGELVKENQYRFHAFNGGQRLCLGQALATYESVAVMAAIFKNFDLEFADGWLKTTAMVDMPGDTVPTPRYQDSLTLPMFAPLLVKVTRRAKA